MHVIQVLKRHWRPLLVLNGLVLAATIGVACYYPRTWTATTRIILPSTNKNAEISLGALGEVRETGTSFSSEVNALKVQSAILTSSEVLSKAWQADPQREKYPQLGSYEKLFKAVPQSQTTILAVEAKGNAPEVAEARADLVVRSYVARLEELRNAYAASRDTLSQKELDRARRELTRAEAALARFKRSTGLVNTDQQTGGLVGVISSLTTSQAQAVAEGTADKARAQMLTARLGMDAPQAMRALRLGESKEYQAMRLKLSSLDTALAEARGLYTEKHARVQSLLVQREELQRSLRELLAKVVPASRTERALDDSLAGGGNRDSRIDLILSLLEAERAAEARSRQSAQLGRTIEQATERLSAISTRQATLLDLQRRYELAEAAYKAIVAQMQQARLSAFNAFPDIEVLDKAYSNPKEANPRTLLIALGGLVAAVFGSLGLILRKEAINPLLGPKDLQSVELPVLARLPRTKGLLPSGDPPRLESRQLASTVSLMDLPNRRLMITSSTAGEGKTTLTLGLANALAEMGFRVLLVDADFRQASLSRLLGHGPQVEGTQAEPVSVIADLDLVPALAIEDTSTAFFVQGGFERYLDDVQTDGYDYVLVDSPPISLTSEAALMIPAVRNVLFVVRPGVSGRDAVSESLDRLVRHNARLVGLVVNDVTTRQEGYRYSYGRYGRQSLEVAP
ncbi:GumC family protein [Gloeobacter violaceus]|uniref:Gll3716 protein n=1 Tax=Gloeobacter violaceus (strain ATCC 29082 / PCC 7421) TaxID=251221 RepID=Q7NF11_GLOVI|nr:tyrosine-protein kinase domain-containing protein [Gloeobacter violaceus]BAC91657.1 gll3716 [Gloeobacter violaceus PCC 7421]